jgi:hypothetical protein
MRREWILAFASAIAILMASNSLYRNFALPGSDNDDPADAARSTAAAHPSIVVNQEEGDVDVYVENSKVFSLATDWCDNPVFVYPFADNKRFLCDYNLDGVKLMFVVDLDLSHTNFLRQTGRSADGNQKIDLSSFATKVVFDGRYVVRPPRGVEMKEVRESLSRMNRGQINSTSFPFCDFEFYRTNANKSRLDQARF